MDAKFFKTGSSLVWLVVCSVAIAFVAFNSSMRSQTSEDDCHCHPWEYCDSDKECHDLPHVHHYHGEHHEPAGGETCWVECLCEEGTSPGSDNCAPCEFVGTVCISR
jgi:hypothetical protein